MNRKGQQQRGQNDISIIIRNLPKRLQQKIAEDTGEVEINAVNHDAAVAAKGGSASERAVKEEGGTVQSQQCLDQPPRIDLFLRSKMSVAADSKNQVATDVDAMGASAIRGILRLGATESAQLTKAKEENGRRQTPRQRLQEASEMSPTHQAPPPRSAAAAAQYPTWFDALDAPFCGELPPLYDTLTGLIKTNLVLENWRDFCETRTQLQHIFQQLLLQQLKFCCEQKVDTFFWKLLFYHPREHLKAQKSPEAAKATLALIDAGMEFYGNLLDLLSSKYLTLAAGESATVRNGARGRRQKFEFIAKVAAQKLLICLGDLSRYRTNQLQTGNDFAEAARFYHRAQALIPSNGIPYNQLAIVAICARKKFDAIYFHMRSLMSSNAICSARESLLVLFDEIRKKYEETELKASPLHRHNTKSGHVDSSSSSCSNSRSMRREVWLHPDGVRRLHRTDINGNHNNKTITSEEKRYSELAPVDLLHRFTSLYLYVIGKLYTGIGMESIREHQRRLLSLLSAMHSHSNALCITCSRMLKMVALNIFVMEHNAHKDSRREIRYHAFNFCNEMFGLMLRKCNKLLAEFTKNETDDEPFEGFADLNTLLQFIKIYTDWLAENVEIWEPIRSEEHIFINCWDELQLTFPLIQIAQLKRNETTEFHVNPQQQQQQLLDEDNFLIGFTPLTATNTPKRSVPSIVLSEAAQFQLRLARIAEFQQCYIANCGLLEAASAEQSHFVLEDLNMVIESALANLKEGAGRGESDDYDFDDDDDNSENSENIIINGYNKIQSAAPPLKFTTVRQAATARDDAQMSQLTKLKKELEAKTNVKRIYNAKLEEILKFVDTAMYIEVRPKYLLPDTNCFIDCLEDFESLTQAYKRYTLVIPLTVVKELDGLSKGVKLESYEKSLQKHRIHHFDDVSTRAKKSLDFIKMAKNNVKCATTKGSIINASLFALVEEEHVSNDDKILATALALSKTMSTETSSDGKCFIQTELVLITTDRNLRVKALSRNLAVCELNEFLQWAKDSNT